MSINLEEDKVDSLANTNDMKELSEQVIKLRTLEDKFAAKEEELKRAKEQEQSIASLVKAKQEEEAQIKEKLKQEKTAEQIRRETCQAFSLMRAPVEGLTQAVTKIEGKNVPITNIPGGSPHMAIDSRNIEIRLDTLNETLQDLLPQVVSGVSQVTSATDNVARVVDDLTFRG